MALHDNLFGTFRDSVGLAAKKASEAVEAAKISYEIRAKEDELAKVYTKIGKHYYEWQAQQAEVSRDIFLKLFSSAETIRSVIAALKSQLAVVKETLTCMSCGAENPKSSSYCGKCGKNLRSGEGAGNGAGGGAGASPYAFAQDVEYRESGGGSPDAAGRDGGQDAGGDG
jgi:ribosomal protein L40E